MQEDLMNPSHNIGDKGFLFNGGPLHNKVIKMPYGIDVYAYTYMGHRHFYRVYSTGAYYQHSEKLN